MSASNVNYNPGSSQDINSIIAECLASMGVEYQELVNDLNGVNQDQTEIAKDQSKINAKTRVRHTHHVPNPTKDHPKATKTVYTYQTVNKYSDTQIAEFKNDILLREENEHNVQNAFNTASGYLERISNEIATFLASVGGGKGDEQEITSDLNQVIQNLLQIYKQMSQEDSSDTTNGDLVNHPVTEEKASALPVQAASQQTVVSASVANQNQLPVAPETVNGQLPVDGLLTSAVQNALQPLLTAYASGSSDFSPSIQASASAISSNSQLTLEERKLALTSLIVLALGLTSHQSEGTQHPLDFVLSAQSKERQEETLTALFASVVDKATATTRVLAALAQVDAAPLSDRSVASGAVLAPSTIAATVATPAMDAALAAAIQSVKLTVLASLRETLDATVETAVLAVVSPFQSETDVLPVAQTKGDTAPVEVPTVVQPRALPIYQAARQSISLILDQTVGAVVEKTTILSLQQSTFQPASTAPIAALAGHEAVLAVAQQIPAGIVLASNPANPLPPSSKATVATVVNQSVARVLGVPVERVEEASLVTGSQQILDASLVQQKQTADENSAENPVYTTDSVQQFFSLLDEVVGSGSIAQVAAEGAVSALIRSASSLQSLLTDTQIGALAAALSRGEAIQEIGDPHSRGVVNSLSTEVVKEKNQEETKGKNESSQESEGSEAHLQADLYHQILAV